MSSFFNALCGPLGSWAEIQFSPLSQTAPLGGGGTSSTEDSPSNDVAKSHVGNAPLTPDELGSMCSVGVEGEDGRTLPPGPPAGGRSQDKCAEHTDTSSGPASPQDVAQAPRQMGMERGKGAGMPDVVGLGGVSMHTMKEEKGKGGLGAPCAWPRLDASEPPPTRPFPPSLESLEAPAATAGSHASLPQRAASEVRGAYARMDDKLDGSPLDFEHREAIQRLVEFFYWMPLSDSWRTNDILREMYRIVSSAGWDVYPFQSGQKERSLAAEAQGSRRGSAWNVHSSLHHHWGEDVLRGRAHRHSVRPTDCYCMNNVDFYLNVDAWRQIAQGQPILLRTLIVDRPCGVMNHGEWRFVENKLHMSMRAWDSSAETRRYVKFEHELWDFQHGQVVDFGDWLYRVHIKAPVPGCEQYRLVLLEPVWTSPGGCCRKLWNLACCGGESWGKPDDCQRLQRLRVTRRGEKQSWSIMRTAAIGQGAEPEIHIALDHQTTFFSLKASDYALAMAGEINCFSLKESFDVKSSKDRLLLLTFVKDMTGRAIHDSEPQTIAYEVGSSKGPTSAKRPKSCFPLCDALLVAPVTPLTSQANEEAGVVGRVTGIQHPNDMRLNKDILPYMREFVDLAVPPEVKAGKKLRVESNDLVVARQNDARKRLTFECSAMMDDWEDPGFAQTGFLKKENDGGELSGAIKCQPRVITPFEGYGKTRYMGVVLAVKHGVTSRLHAFMVGRTVCYIEDAVKQLAGGARLFKLLQTDLSRQDGRKGVVGRMLWHMLLESCFEGQELRDALDLHRRSFGTKVKTRNKVRWETYFAMGSGAPDTTENNTFENLFLMYLAKRLSGASASEAWSWCQTNVLVAGDDGLISGIESSFYQEACVLCGHLGKVAIAKDEVFRFLGRLFPKVSLAACCTDSMQDPLRVFVKLTITTECLPTVMLVRRRLFEKACAVWATDEHTPWLKDVLWHIINAGQREYKWDFFKSTKHLNYLVDANGKTYTSLNLGQTGKVESWKEVAIRSALPDVDLDAFAAFWARDNKAMLAGGFEYIQAHNSHHSRFTLRRSQDAAALQNVSTHVVDSRGNVTQTQAGDKSTLKTIPEENKGGGVLARETFDKIWKGEHGVDGSGSKATKSVPAPQGDKSSADTDKSQQGAASRRTGTKHQGPAADKAPQTSRKVGIEKKSASVHKTPIRPPGARVAVKASTHDRPPGRVAVKAIACDGKVESVPQRGKGSGQRQPPFPRARVETPTPPKSTAEGGKTKGFGLTSPPPSPPDTDDDEEIDPEELAELLLETETPPSAPQRSATSRPAQPLPPSTPATEVSQWRAVFFAGAAGGGPLVIAGVLQTWGAGGGAAGPGG